MKYSLELKNAYPFPFYQAHASSYSTEELLMAAIECKKNIAKKILDFYQDNLVISIKVCNVISPFGKAIAVVDYTAKDVYAATTVSIGEQQISYARTMFGPQNASSLIKDNDTFQKQIEPALRYMMIFHCDDIIEIISKSFNQVCVADAFIHQLIKAFQDSHKES